MSSESVLSTSTSTSKSKNQLKNEAKRAEKLKKFQEKIDKVGDLSKTAQSKKQTTSYSSEIEVPVTPHGCKKVLSEEMASSYSPKAVEAYWYSWWEQSGFFTPEYYRNHHKKDESGGGLVSKPFVIVLPPPNVTGSLHIGHALMASVEDAIVRWQRMSGKEVLFLPGCDHAALSTQAVVEKKLKNEEGLTKYDLGRENFLKKVWQYKEKYGNRIYEQLKRIGASLDWNRARFTMDDHLVKAVNESFVRLFDDGLIFRAERLVNWSGKLQTTLSDLEVEMEEIEGGSWISVSGHKKDKYQFGSMTYIAYPVEGFPGDEIIIATTRPETLFADTALAVHPNDERFKKYHGKNVIHPVTKKIIPIIQDEIVDQTFGTGALKVSPAHDFIDFEIGKRHNLPFVSIFDENNILNQNTGSFCGLARYDAREAVIEHLKNTGYFRDQKLLLRSVLPLCSKSKDIVEPRLIPQWWCDCADMAKKALNALIRDHTLEILPLDYQKQWIHWLENIKDWCLSRQQWWGHRVPAYLVSITGEKLEKEIWIAARSIEEAHERAFNMFPQFPKNSISLKQDDDVLDTWFSAGLWPFSTMGWPDVNHPDFIRYYPNSLLETGGDILFFWVARMVMFGIYFTGKVPFSTVFLHAMVRDAYGRKMSKTLGNVIDPIDIIEGVSLEKLHETLFTGNLDKKEIETAKAGQKKDYPNGIPECGTDALRFTLCSYVAHGKDVNVNVSKIDANRRFCNKIWNAVKFALSKLHGFVPDNSSFITEIREKATVNEKWILTRLQNTIKSVNENFNNYNLMSATIAIHNFWIYELCDFYIEAVKPYLNDEPKNIEHHVIKSVLHYCIDQGLKLLHPFMPYLTEELFQRININNPINNLYPSICISAFPIFRDELLFEYESQQFDRITDIVKSIRSAASDSSVPNNVKKGNIALRLINENDQKLIESNIDSVKSLIKSFGKLSLANDVPDNLSKLGICDSNDSKIGELFF